MNKLIWLALVLLVCACGQENKTERYSYNINENGCATGKHEFNSHNDYCAALKSDEVNNFCAWSSRKGYYERDCGSDWAFNSGN